MIVRLADRCRAFVRRCLPYSLRRHRFWTNCKSPRCVFQSIRGLETWFGPLARQPFCSYDGPAGNCRHLWFGTHRDTLLRSENDPDLRQKKRSCFSQPTWDVRFGTALTYNSWPDHLPRMRLANLKFCTNPRASVSAQSPTHSATSASRSLGPVVAISDK